MRNDPLDKGVSISAELTESGVTAKAESRTVSAIDRLVGSIADLLGFKMEHGPAIERAKTEAETKVIEATGEYLANQIGKDEALTKRALEKYLGNVVRAQENKEAVAHIAITDLRETPPTDDEENTGEASLNPEFMDRFESYADSASTEELRAKWGRVLAAEIRQPGTFSNKVLRVVDEIDHTTAHLFTALCEHRLSRFIPKCLADELTAPQLADLVSAELIIEPGLGQATKFNEYGAPDGSKAWLVPFDDVGIGFQKERGFNLRSKSLTLVTSEGAPAIPVYVLTSVGVAISKILPKVSSHSIEALRDHVQSELGSNPVLIYRRTKNGMWVAVEVESEIHEGAAETRAD